jgi:hypothetical protein
MKLQHTLSALSTALLLTMTGTSLADDGGDRWRFDVTVPLWAAGIDGDVTVRGVTRDVSIEFDKLKDHLDAAFSLAVDARKGKLGFFGGVSYLKFSADADAAGTHGSDKLKLLFGGAGISYQLYKSGGPHPFLLFGTLGVRGWDTKNELRVTGRRGEVLVDASKDQYLVDPEIGLGASFFLTPKLHLDFSGDVGGGDLSDNTADVDWSAAGVITYDFKSWFSLSGGYQAIGLDYSKGSGIDKNGLNIILHGLLIAATLKF